MRKKGMLLLLILLIAVVFVWSLAAYHVVDAKLYPKNAESLDLRGQEIRASHYEKLRARLPDVEIRWDVPFQVGLLADDTTEVTVVQLTAEDAAVLAAYLPELRKVEAEGCSDYENLLWLKQHRPEVQVDYRVPLDGRDYASSAAGVTLKNVTEDELALLQYLPSLETVTVTGGEAEMLGKLREHCTQKGIDIRIGIRGAIYSKKSEAIRIEGIGNEELELFYLLPELDHLHLVEPNANAEALIALAAHFPAGKVTWEKSVMGLTFRSDAAQIDLTDAVSLAPGEVLGDKTGYQYGMDFQVQGAQEEVPTAIKISKFHPIADRTEETKELIAEAEAAMAYFPNAEKVILCGALLHNIFMSDFREQHRDDYKVVWSVQCGDVLTRTDATFFMPVKYNVYYLQDMEAFNLRFCEDIVAMDIGHMAVSDISFVKYMPDLEYLILAHTKVKYVEPLRTCKKLKFLEVDHSSILDFSPLVDCTGLEDLNITNTVADLEPLKQMTWLKNLWIVTRREESLVMVDALPDTHIVRSSYVPPDGHWRNLPNYFAMRDALRMYYMTWTGAIIKE